MKNAARFYEQSTVLELGARGRLDGRPFSLAGRTCVKSKSGGLWNEWLMRFTDGKGVRWLAEARGTFTVYGEGAIVPSWDALRAGAPLETPWVVVERGIASRVLSAGDVPEGPSEYRYVDLSSKRGESATIDFGSDPPAVFVGRKATLSELGLTPREKRPSFFPMPDVSRPKGVDLWLDVGDHGTLQNTSFAVLGVLARSMRVARERWSWQEYLLFDSAQGFRWLVVSDGHWSLVEPVEPGLVVETDRGATLDGETYRPLSSGTARLDWTAGELPWDAAVGDVTDVRDYVHAPWILSRESSEDEVTWSRSTYLSPDAVARAFGKRALPKPIGRAPHQPRKR